MVLLTNVENTMDRKCEKQESFEENRSYKETAANNQKFFGQIMRKKRLREFNTRPLGALKAKETRKTTE